MLIATMTCKAMSGATTGLTCSACQKHQKTLCQILKIVHLKYKQTMWKLLLECPIILTLPVWMGATIYLLLPAAALCSLPPDNLA